MRPKKGEFYKHFKGNTYMVQGLALHHETQEELVIYKSFKDEISWVRPLQEFMNDHPSGVKRFTKMEVHE
ncbi:DUF1653 domain-containing protein [Halobacillus ihumii]|uniref:DUF1653 domain-containing protein n=1 Tax=Halobacillus ihumii TaxID=2686092 RepID=UPI0013D64D95|nr:DUF1653 domain-containing protein [Halobacillus ihumii]